MNVETRSTRPPVRNTRLFCRSVSLSPVLGVEVLHSVDLDHDDSAVVGLEFGIDVPVPSLGSLRRDWRIGWGNPCLRQICANSCSLRLDTPDEYSSTSSKSRALRAARGRPRSS